jgi:conjugal transfer pilus assembly protein TraK
MFKKLSLLSAALFLSICSVVNADAPFRNANQIPSPSKGGAGSQYIPLPQSSSSDLSGSTKTQVAQLPHESLTNAGMLARKPISLDAANLKQQTVVIDNDDTHVLPVSSSSMNRVNTPFRNPIVLVNGGAQYKIVGQDVYMVMESDQPVGVYIREDDNISNNSPVASLTLVPKPIPMQNISVVLANTLRERLSNPNAKLATDYTDVLRVTISQVSVGKLPDGYSKSNVKEKVIARVGAVTLQPKAIYSGVENNVYVYTATNVSGQYVELSEPSFWHKGVRAVTFNDKLKLKPNDQTEVIIIADVGSGDESIYD